MRHLTPAAAVLALLLASAGCAQHERIAYDTAYFYDRLDRDVVRYVDLLDRELRLDGGQERRIRRLLASRTRHLLEHTRPGVRDVVYPFPRRRHRSRVERRWWRDADRHILQALSERQRDRYVDLVRTGRLQADGERDARPRRRRGA